MTRTRICLLLTALTTATCSGGMITNPSANLESAELQNGKGVDDNNGNGDGNGSVCGAPRTTGSIDSNAVICANQNVTLRVVGAFVAPVNIAIQTPNGTSITGTMNLCGLCMYTFDWNVPNGAPTGVYDINVSDSNAMTFAFDVTVNASGTCGGDQDGNNGGSYGDGGGRSGDGGSSYRDRRGGGDGRRHDGGDRDGGGDEDGGRRGGGYGGTTCGGSGTTTTTTGGGTTGTTTGGGTTGTTTGINPNTVTISQ